MNDVLPCQWHHLLRAWAVDPALADRTFEEIQEYYAGPGRFYHTLDHVQNMLETVESLRSYARNVNAVKLATWLHDVVYDSKASHNEGTISGGVYRAVYRRGQFRRRLSAPERKRWQWLAPAPNRRRRAPNCPLRKKQNETVPGGRNHPRPSSAKTRSWC